MTLDKARPNLGHALSASGWTAMIKTTSPKKSPERSLWGFRFVNTWNTSSHLPSQSIAHLM